MTRTAQRKGAITPMVAVALIGLLGMAAMTIDVGFMLMAKQQLQAATDSAALAGVGILQSELDQYQAEDVVVAAAAANKVIGQSLTVDPDVDIEIGAWDEGAGEIIPFDDSGGAPSVPDGVVAVKVTARRTADSPDGPIALHFARILGKDTANITASSTAGLTISQRARPPVEVLIVQDQSGSFADEFPDARDADVQFVNFMREAYADDDRLAFCGFGQHAYHEFRDSSTKADTNLFHDLCLNDDHHEQQYEQGGEMRDPFSDYIEDIPTVPYNTAPEHNSWTNVYTGLLRAASAFAAPEDRDAAWGTFCDNFWTDEYWTDGHSADRWSKGTRWQWEPTEDYDDERYTRYTTVDGQLYGRLETSNYIHKDIGWWQHKAGYDGREQLRDWMAPLFDLEFENPDAEHVVVLVSDGMPWWAGGGFPDSRSKDLCQYVADELAERGVRIHTVTLDQSAEPGDGSMGADAEFNASLVRNGGYAFYTYDAEKLSNLMIGVGQIEVGQAHLIN